MGLDMYMSSSSDTGAVSLLFPLYDDVPLLGVDGGNGG